MKGSLQIVLILIVSALLSVLASSDRQSSKGISARGVQSVLNECYSRLVTKTTLTDKWPSDLASAWPQSERQGRSEIFAQVEFNRDIAGKPRAWVQQRSNEFVPVLIYRGRESAPNGLVTVVTANGAIVFEQPSNLKDWHFAAEAR